MCRSWIDFRKMCRCCHVSLSFAVLFLIHSPCVSVESGSASEAAGEENSFNYCLDGMHHKSAPGPESSLYNVCSPWKDRSCCTHNTTVRISDLTLYPSLNFTHCQPLSESCKEYFVKDLCFYECSPNVGPWVEKIEGMKVRKEQYKNVPLCKSDCDSWFNACKNDFLCSRNWIEDGKCNETSYCSSVQDMYRTAKSFCEEIWNHSWTYTPDDEPCMKMWFDPSQGNPNDAVTLSAIKRTQSTQNTEETNTVPILLVFLALLAVIFVVFILIRKNCFESRYSISSVHFRNLGGGLLKS